MVAEKTWLERPDDFTAMGQPSKDVRKNSLIIELRHQRFATEQSFLRYPPSFGWSSASHFCADSLSMIRATVSSQVDSTTDYF